MKLKQIRVDGYKNLIDCCLDLSDFNVIVGPNNSGKSNLFEVIHMLWLICFSDERLRGRAFEGFTLPRVSSSICHLDEYKNKPLTIAFSFYSEKWLFDYELIVCCNESESNNRGFLSEKLTGKNPDKTGRAKTYISRDNEKIKVLNIERSIGKTIPSISAIEALYPDIEEKSPELSMFLNEIRGLSLASTFTLSPTALRNEITKETNVGSFSVSSFDLLPMVDSIKEDGSNFNLFKESACDILEIEDLFLFAKDIAPPSTKDITKKQRIRHLFLKQKGGEFARIEEFSDGTILVVAILALVLADEEFSPVLFLEEIENCLHPSAVRKLIRFLREHTRQCPVVLTTHSPYVLNDINPENVHVAIIGDDGATHFEKIRNSKKLRDYLRSGFMSFGDMLVSNFEDVLGE